MATLNFNTTVTDWTTNSGSATAVPNSIPKTQFESMLTELVPTTNFLDRSIVVNESGDAAHDFRVESDANTHALHVDASSNAVGIGGAASTSTYELTVTGNTKLTSASGGTELIVEDTGSGSSARIDVVGDTTSLVMDFDSTGTGTTEGFFLIRDTGQTTDNAFSLKNDGDNILFRTYDYDGSASGGWNEAIIIDNATGNVGIGGSAATSSYELKVHGNMQIAGDDVGTTTELVVVDTTNIARILVDGEQGSDIHVRSDAGDAEIFLTTLTDTSTTNNQFNIRNNGTETQFIVYDYNQTTTPNSSNGDVAIEIANSTGFVGINGSPATFPSASSDPTNAPSNSSAVLSCHGHLYVANSIAFHTAARIDRMTGMNRQSSDWLDIFKGVARYHTTLSTAISDTATAPITITVADSSVFGTAGSILINGEQFTISGNNTSTNELTLSARGQGSTTAEAHSTGDIVSHSTSTGGLLIDGYNSAHTVVAVRANDVNDGFSVVVSEDTGDAEDEEVTFRQLLKASQQGVVINEHGEADFDFRVESDTNPNMLHVDAGNNAVGIGGAADTTNLYELTVHGNTILRNSGSSGTELTVYDDTAMAVMSVNGNTGGSIDVRSNSGDASITMHSDVTETTANTFQIVNSDVANQTYFKVMGTDFSATPNTQNNILSPIIIDNATGQIGMHTTPVSGYELAVLGQVLIGASSLIGTGATHNSTGGTPFASTYGPSGTHPAEVIISQGSHANGTGLLVQNSAANNDATTVDNATVSIQANGTPLLQLFDTNGTGNISHIYHSGNTFNVDWSMTNGSIASGNQHKIFKAMANHKLCQTVGTGSNDSGAMSVHDGVGDPASGDQNSQSISFYIDGSNLKVQFVASDGTTATTGTVCTLS